MKHLAEAWPLVWPTLYFVSVIVVMVVSMFLFDKLLNKAER